MLDGVAEVLPGGKGIIGVAEADETDFLHAHAWARLKEREGVPGLGFPPRVGAAPQTVHGSDSRFQGGDPAESVAGLAVGYARDLVGKDVTDGREDGVGGLKVQTANQQRSRHDEVPLLFTKRSVSGLYQCATGAAALRIVQGMASRSEASRSAILEATIELLEDTTVQKLSIEAIAKEAGVGKTTIYRWWPSKAAVVIDAFLELHLTNTPIPEDLPVREALGVHLRSLIRQYRSPTGRLVAQLIAESQYDPETLATFRGRFWDGRRAAVTALVERGIREGEVRDSIDAELVTEMIYSPVILRLLFGHRPLSEEYAQQAIDVAFDGLGASAPVSA